MRAVSLRAVLAAGALALGPLVIAACSWSPSHPFEREAPAVREAIKVLDGGGDATVAAATLEDYLSTGACKEGSIGLPDSVRKLPNGSFDLSLALFKIGEAYGTRFGDEEMDAGLGDLQRQQRAGQIACALEIAQHVASDPSGDLALRAHARYLEGNLDFLGSDYQAAVKAYDQAIAMAPGAIDAGDPFGRDAAWNRAIALRRIEDQKDAGNDAAPPDGGGDAAQPDSGQGDGSSPDSGNSGDSGSQPKQPDAGSEGDSGNEPPPQADAAPPPQPESADDRVLDQFENAPTVQQEDAKRRAARRRVRASGDK